MFQKYDKFSILIITLCLNNRCSINFEAFCETKELKTSAMFFNFVKFQIEQTFGIVTTKTRVFEIHSFFMESKFLTRKIINCV